MPLAFNQVEMEGTYSYGTSKVNLVPKKCKDGFRTAAFVLRATSCITILFLVFKKRNSFQENTKVRLRLVSSEKDDIMTF